MVNSIKLILVALIAIEHLFFMWMQLFNWQSLGGKMVRTLPKGLYNFTRKIVANQGVYNGFIAAGLIWSLIISEHSWSTNIQAFFLTFIIIAGFFGGITISKKIFYLQSIPAMICLFLVITSYF